VDEAAGLGIQAGRAAADRLAALGICEIAPGLSDVELARTEQLFGIEFSVEHRAFLSAGLPLDVEDRLSGDSATYRRARTWPDWRSADSAEIRGQLAGPSTVPCSTSGTTTLFLATRAIPSPGGDTLG
jgi:hypothetical protein